MQPQLRQRNNGIDAARYVLCLAVVVLHTLLFVQYTWAAFVAMLCRAAVPFFFITSGYFMKAEKHLNIQVLLKPLRRLLPIYLFWLLTYYLFGRLVLGLVWPIHLHDLISGGRAFHLWFLPALGFGLVFVGAGLALAGPRITSVACAVLAGFSLTAGSYHGILHLGSPARGGLLVAPMYVFIGHFLAQRTVSLGRSWLIASVAGSYALLIAEEILIAHWSGGQIESHDFTIGTFFVGTAVFLLARSLSESPPFTRLAALGGISLSVYASHLLFLWVVVPLIGTDSLWRVALVAFTVFVLATAFSLGLRRTSNIQAASRLGSWWSGGRTLGHGGAKS